MKKQYLLFLLIIPVLVAVWFFWPSLTSGVKEYDYRYTVLDDGTVKIISYSGKDRILKAPAALARRTVTAIGDYAFYYNVPTYEITIPNNIVTLGANPFLRGESLRKIHVSPDHPTLAVVDGALVDKIEGRIVSYPRSTTEVVIPEGYAIIGDKAYSSCPLVETVIPEGVTTIGAGAFYYCTTMTSVEIPDSVITIGEEAFMECVELTAVNIPDSVTTIGNRAFTRCKSLLELTIPDSVTEIGRNAFLACYALTLSVGEGSYAEQYAIENDIPYVYTNAAA